MKNLVNNKKQMKKSLMFFTLLVAVICLMAWVPAANAQNDCCCSCQNGVTETIEDFYGSCESSCDTFCYYNYESMLLSAEIGACYSTPLNEYEIFGYVKSDGTALSGISVTVYDSNTQTGSTKTNTDGYYVVSGLSPGTYYVGASDSDGNYLDQWYNGKSDQAGADSVVLDSVNMSVQADFNLDKKTTEPVFSIGQVSQRSDGSGYLDVTVSITGEDGQSFLWDNPNSSYLAGPNFDTPAPLSGLFISDTDQPIVLNNGTATAPAVIDAHAWASGNYKLGLGFSSPDGTFSTTKDSAAFYLDNTSPSDPILNASTPPQGSTTNQTTIGFDWTPAEDDSGIAGFSWVIDSNQVTTPDQVVDGTSVPTDITIGPEDGTFYFHLSTRDILGNWTSTVHAGPWILRTSPNTVPGRPSGVSPDNDVFTPAETITLQASAFEDADGDTAKGSSWKLRRADGEILLFEQTGNADLSSYTFSQGQLVSDMRYEWKTRYTDQWNGVSNWSEKKVFLLGNPTEGNKIEVGPEFKMIGFTRWPNPKTPYAINLFGSIIGDYNGSNFKIGGFDPQTGAYVEYGNKLVIDPGKSYWFWAAKPTTITLTGVPVSTKHAIEVKLEYGQENGNGGWNMIACPYDKGFYWSKVLIKVYDADMENFEGPFTLSQAGSYIEPWLWRYVGNETYDKHTEIMEKNTGYWVKVKQKNVFLKFPVSGQVDETKTAFPVTGGKTLKSDDSDSQPPPAPMGVYEKRSGTGESDSGTSGCFIETTSDQSEMDSH